LLHREKTQECSEKTNNNRLHRIRVYYLKVLIL
jgi:hypothetical protein